MTHDIGSLIDQLRNEADKYDAEFRGYELSGVNAAINVFTRAMYDELPADNFLKEYFPTVLAQRLDEIKERAVMKKLES
jgi:hypothetical protein